MEKRRSFGSYLREKRLERGITMRTICEALKVSLPYMSDIENDRRNPLDKDKLDQLMGILCLPKEEQQELYYKSPEQYSSQHSKKYQTLLKVY